MKIGLIYGSDTGYTEQVSNGIKSYFGNFNITLHEIHIIDKKIILMYDFLIFGVPTWNIGELQSDWDYYFEEFKSINFNDKLIAIFGLGDQIGYEDNFVDGIGILAKEIIKNNGKIIGEWSTKGYKFKKSKALKDKNNFYGLAIDEDNQYDQTEERIKKWCNLIIENEDFKKLK
tara:strand:+ start:609 stop:1130 length:522 start_codon:yes stop_codon:yes gene_type:complete